MADNTRLAEYAGALEAIIRAVPGNPVINGVPMSAEEALANLRRRFGVDGQIIDQATLQARIVSEGDPPGRSDA